MADHTPRRLQLGPHQRAARRAATSLAIAAVALGLSGCPAPASHPNGSATPPAAAAAPTPTPEPGRPLLLESFLLELVDDVLVTDAETLVAAARGEAAGLIAAGGDGAADLPARLEAAAADGRLRILMATRTLTRTGAHTSSRTGYQVAVQTVASNQTTVQFVDATLRTGVGSAMTGDGRIALDLDMARRRPRFDLLARALSGALASSPPIEGTGQRATSVVANGGTAVVRGVQGRVDDRPAPELALLVTATLVDL